MNILEKYFLILITALIGGLVLALRLQGSKLHKAQIDLLHKQFQDQVVAQEAATAKAQQIFEDALHAYMENKGE